MKRENESDHSDKTSQENQITGRSANLRRHTKEPTKNPEKFHVWKSDGTVLFKIRKWYFIMLPNVQL